MRPLITLVFLLTFKVSYSQELDIFQSDSIYAKNKISKRIMYSINGNSLQREIETYYNSAGQKIKQFWFWNGETNFHNVETFYYSNNGLLSSIVDSTEEGNIEITKYYYENDTLQYRVTLDQEKDTIEFRLYPDKKTTIKRWYRDYKPYRIDTTIFETENAKLEYFGSEIFENPEKVFRWHYKFVNQFDSNGNLLTVTVKVEKPYNSFTRYVYDDRNLIIKKQEVFLHKRKEYVQNAYYFTYE